MFDYFKALENQNSCLTGAVRSWCFLPGMLFGSPQQWWREEALRPVPHEGLDICFYEDTSGKLLQVDSSVQVPVLGDGTVVNVCRDLMASSVFVQHQKSGSKRLLSVYGHITTHRGVARGAHIQRGALIGNVAQPKNTCPLPPHLHISVLWVDNDFSDDALHWGFLGKCKRCKWLDPFDVIVRPPMVFREAFPG